MKPTVLNKESVYTDSLNHNDYNHQGSFIYLPNFFAGKRKKLFE